jgi:hypothetical protein
MTEMAQQAEVAVRRARAVRLKLEGKTYQEIADEMGYPSRQTAHSDVKRAMQERKAELGLTVDEYREFELESIDAWMAAATGVMKRQHVVVSHGRVVREGEPFIDEETGRAKIAEGAGAPLVDDAPVLQAIDRLQRLQAARRALLGLDTPVTQKVEGNLAVTYTVVGVDTEAMK